MPDDVTLMATTPPARDRLLAARLRSQRLAGVPAGDALEATRSLLAIQAQDPRGARLAIRARTGRGHASDVDRALTVDRSLIITWVNRGTLHLVASEDEPLLHALTTPQLRAASDRRLAQEGVNPAAAERGIAAIVRALGDRGPMTRTQIRTVLERARVPHAGQAPAHVLFRATVDGLLVRGPLVGDEHAFVLSADWLGERPSLDRERALAELARRYLAGHGPADDRDLAKWANVPLRDARAGLQAIAPELHERPDGLLQPRGHRAGRLPPPRLLGPFDPLLLGWRSRTFVLDHPPEVVTTNGIIRPIALVGGRAAGTWKMPGGRVELNLWSEPDEPTAGALRDEALAVETYLGDRPPRPGGREASAGSGARRDARAGDDA